MRSGTGSLEIRSREEEEEEEHSLPAGTKGWLGCCSVKHQKAHYNLKRRQLTRQALVGSR